MPYTYNFFNNGTPIDVFHRRIYNSIEKRQHRFINPFETGPGTLFEIFKLKKLVRSNQKHLNSSINLNPKLGLGMKLSILQTIFNLLLKIIGYRRYLYFLRFLKLFSRYESQIYLIDRKFNKDNLPFS